MQINEVSETNLAGKCQEYQEKLYLKNREIQSPENEASTYNIDEKTYYFTACLRRSNCEPENKCLI